MGIRYEYKGPPLQVTPPSLDIEVRAPARTDIPLLTGLYLLAFKDTVDEAPLMSRELLNYFHGKYGVPQLHLSRIVFIENELVAVSLVSLWHDYPSVELLAVRPSFRRKGLASYLLNETLKDLRYHACTFITRGNTPSESIFGKFGFHQVPHVEEDMLKVIWPECLRKR